MTVEQKIASAKLATRASFFILLLILTINLWVKGEPIIAYPFTLLPLIVFIPGIIEGGIRTLIWVCFVMLPFFVAAIWKVSGPEPQNFDFIELILVVILFSAATINARLRQKNNLQ